MRKLNLILFVLFIIPTSAVFGQLDKNDADEFTRINDYTKSINSFVEKEKRPHIIFADVADYNKAEKAVWKRYESEKELEKAREKEESYTIAYLWKKDGKIVQANYTYSSPSGDWAEYYYHTYYQDGTIAKSVKELRTFVGDVIANETKFYDKKGTIRNTSKTFRDLNTNKIIKESDANYQKMDVGTIYKNIADIPFLNSKETSDIKDFIPTGWRLETKIVGDLNKDSLVDVVLQLTEIQEGNEEPKRILLILLKKKDGKYMKAAEAKTLLLCQGCGGVIGGPATVVIKKGVLLVSQLSGSRNATNMLHRFRYEAKTKRFRLIGEDRNDFDRLELTSEETSTNYLTGRQIIKNSKGGENDVKTKVKRKRVLKSKIYFEDVVYGN